MRTSVGRGLAVLAGTLVLTGVSGAADVGAFGVGQTVVRELADSHGHRFAITVTPPRDRAVDARFFDAFEFAGEAASGQPGFKATGVRSKVAVAAAEDDDPIDVSGYGVKIENLSAAACSVNLQASKRKPVSLGAQKELRLTAINSEVMTITAWPTSNDVDVQIDYNDAVCQVSEKNKGELDVAGCIATTCVNSGLMEAYVYNPFNNTAKYVASVVITFSN
jgi:hypothetical protein